MASHVPKPSKVVYFGQNRPKNDAEFLSVLSNIRDTLVKECDCGFWRVFVSSCYKGDRDDQSDHEWKMIIGGSGKSGDPFRINKDGSFQGLHLVNSGSYRYPEESLESDETNDNRNWVVRIYDHMNGEIQTVGPPNPKVKVCDKPPVPPPSYNMRVCCNCNTKCCKEVCIGYAHSEDEYMSMMALCNAQAFNQKCCKGCAEPGKPRPPSGGTWGGGGGIGYGGGGGWPGYGGGGGGGTWGGGGTIGYGEPPVRFCSCNDLNGTIVDGNGHLVDMTSGKRRCKLQPGVTYELMVHACEQGKVPDPCIIPDIIACEDKTLDVRKIDDMINLPWFPPIVGPQVIAYKYVDETTYPPTTGLNNRTRF